MAKRALNDYKIEELDVVFKLAFIDDTPSEDDCANANSAMTFMKSAAKVVDELNRTNFKRPPVHLRSLLAGTTSRSTMIGISKWQRRSSERRGVT